MGCGRVRKEVGRVKAVARFMLYTASCILWLSLIFVCILGSLWVADIVGKELFGISIAKIIVRKINERNHKITETTSKGR